MKVDPRILLVDVDSAAAEIADFIENVGYSVYNGDIEKQRAVERSFGIIGEALSRLRRSEPALAGRIPKLREAVDFRNLLAHEYQRVSARAVWDIAVYELPELRLKVQELIAELNLSADFKQTVSDATTETNKDDSSSSLDQFEPPSPFD